MITDIAIGVIGLKIMKYKLFASCNNIIFTGDITYYYKSI